MLNFILKIFYFIWKLYLEVGVIYISVGDFNYVSFSNEWMR